MKWFAEASKRRKWLVGVSGGADSVALLHMLLEQGFRNLVVCHMDHRLRGRPSTEDAAFVKRLAKRLDLPCDTARVEVGRVAEERGESMETTARNVRHEFFRECAARHRCDRLILAHHADDQAETVLWNLLRGSYGLKGMNEVQRVGGLEIHRPLLEWRRSGLRDWLSQRRLGWREDATNAEPVAIRNRLRNEAIPLLDQVSGRDAVASLVRLQEDFSELSAFLQERLGEVDVIDPQGRIHLPQLRNLSPVLAKAAIARYLSQQGISLGREHLVRALEMTGGADFSVINLPGGKRLRRRAGRMFVE